MDVLSLTTESQLNNFISDKLQPTDAYLARCGDVVDKLVRFLQHNVPDKLRPRRVIKYIGNLQIVENLIKGLLQESFDLGLHVLHRKFVFHTLQGGSLGKGTVVIGRSDVDLTLMLARYTQVRDLVRDMDDLLSSLARCLNSYQGVKVVDKNPFCLQTEVTCTGGHTHPADILLAVDVLDIESSRDRVFEKMGGPDKDIMKYYSASFVPLMVDMFARLPTKLKSLIRLVKAWKQHEMTDQRIEWPNSYGFEMVTVYAWIQAGEPVNFNMTRALYSVLMCIVNHRSFKADFGHFVYYSRRFLRPPQFEPYIMDPLDPYDNVYSKKGWDWDQTAQKARKWLQMQLFQGMTDSMRNHW